MNKRLALATLAAALFAVAAPGNAQRIIHVPQGGDYGAVSRAPASRDDLEGIEQRDIVPRTQPRPKKAVLPRWHHDVPPAQAVAPVPAGPKRTMLSAPPSEAAGSLSPIYPTPRWRGTERLTPLPAPKSNEKLEQKIDQTGSVSDLPPEVIDDEPPAEAQH